MPLHLKGLTNE